ncbi:MAG: hypothetical protein KA783_08895 [Chitinophagales bacterium]|jgi:hypothetical protein|nr:hypothetical protein [Sphingobacteriales bacterium]MBP6665081.1 hypothetical protein [Chitinophagales bacterium]MBP7534554.1 hypothetical protein [Chitinophagales bacterium]
MQQMLNIEEIRSQYPNEWVLIGNPLLKNPEIQASIISQLISGIVLFHSKDKRELAYKAREIKSSVENITLIYTGEIPKGRKFWL